MREIIYVIVIINVIIGFVLLYRTPRPFKGRTYRDCIREDDEGEKEGRYLN